MMGLKIMRVIYEIERIPLIFAEFKDQLLMGTMLGFTNS